MLGARKRPREVQNPPKCILRTQSPLVDEKEDAKGFYLGTKNPELKNSQTSWFKSGSVQNSLEPINIFVAVRLLDHTVPL